MCRASESRVHSTASASVARSLSAAPPRPTRTFVKYLAKVWAELKAAGKPFEVVLVAQDTDSEVS